MTTDASTRSAERPAAPLPPHWPAMSLAQAHSKLTAPGARFETEEVAIRGVTTKIWKHAPPTLRHTFLNSRAFAQREFVVYEEDRATFDAFDRAVVALAHELQARGVRKGDRVALVMRNLPEWSVVFFAAACIGAIVTPLNAWWTGPELEYGLINSGAKIAFMDAERFERLAEHLPKCPALTRVYVSRRSDEIADPKIARLESIIGVVNDWRTLPKRELPEVELVPEDDATIFYSSGTTGRPKGVLGTHRNYAQNILTTAAALSRAVLRRGETPPDPATQPQRVTLLAIPLFHVTACSSSMIPAVANGSKLVLMRKWDCEKGLQLIERERVTVAGGVPTIAWQLIEHPNRSKYDLSSLGLVTYGGAPSAPELVRRIKEVLPTSQPGNGWGMTETAAAFSGHSSEDYINRPASCGPVPAVGEAKIMDPEGVRELSVDDVGELWVKGPMIAKAYWNNSEATAQTFVNGWLRTGDVARIDAEGFIYIVDRAKDMLIRGGEDIYCIEVENVLYEHPAVMDAALIGIPHRELGEEPAAVVTLKPGAVVTEDELHAHVAQRLAAFKVPVRVAFWPDTLPRNPAGKILKAELKKAFVS
jgi:long-chain acyl-CoA synthetase